MYPLKKITPPTTKQAIIWLRQRNNINVMALRNKRIKKKKEDAVASRSRIAVLPRG